MSVVFEVFEKCAERTEIAASSSRLLFTDSDSDEGPLRSSAPAASGVC